MASGVKCHADVMEKYRGVKKRDYSFVFFKLNDDLTEIVVDDDEAKVAPNCQVGLEEVKELLPKDEPRYVLLDYRWEEGDRKRDKLVLIAWSPDNSKVKHKMLYSSSLEYLVKSLEGVKKIQANELSDLDNRNVLEKAQTK